MTTKKEKKKMTRFGAIIIMMFMIFGAILTRLSYLQVVKKEYYEARANKNKHKILTTSSPRGDIYDRNGKVLARNKQGFSLIFTETDESRKEFFQTIDNVFKLLNENGEKIIDAFALKVEPYRLEFNTSNEETRKWLELRFKKDRGFNDSIRNKLYKNKSNSELSDEEKKKIDEELLKITPEEMFRSLILEYELYNLIKDKYTDEEWTALKSGEDSEDKLVSELIRQVDLNEIRKYMVVRDTMKMQSFSGYRPVLIANDLYVETAYIFEQIQSELPGISVMKQPIRYYPNNSLASSIIGYIGKIPPYEKEKHEEKGYDINEDYIGMAGIEGIFEDVLRGKRGEESIEVNKFGRKVRTMGEIPCMPGDNIQLTIDSKLQEVLEKSLEDTLVKVRSYGDYKADGVTPDDTHKQNATRGAAVVVDVNNGEILAMTSYPNYDPNLFTVPGRLTDEEFQKYFNPDLEKFGRDYIKRNELTKIESFKGEKIPRDLTEKEKEDYLLNKIFPLVKEGSTARQDQYDIYPKYFYNYATKSLVPPGSLFKMITGIAGLEEGVITESEKIYDAGPYNKRYSSWTGASWMYNVYGGSHGYQNLREAIRDSNNYYFYEVSDRLFEKGGVIDGLGTKKGLDMLAKYAWKYGLGVDMKNGEPTTGIELNENFGQSYNYETGKRNHAVQYTFNIYDYLKKGEAKTWVGTYRPIDVVPDDEKDSKEVYKIKKELTEEIKNQMISENPIEMIKITELLNSLIETEEKMKGKYTDKDKERILQVIGNTIEYDARTEMKSGINLYNASIGQGQNQFTPLQLANYVATIANGGKRYKLHVVNKITDSEKNVIEDYTEPIIMEEVGDSEETLKAIKEGMLMVTQSPTGTSRSAFLGFPILNAAKTGSATFDDDQDDMARTSAATFIGFAPYENPQIAVCVVGFDSGHGGYVAPVARAIYEEYFKEEVLKKDPKYKFMYPSEEKKKEKVQDTTVKSGN